MKTKEQKRLEAQVRQEEHNALSTVEKLDKAVRNGSAQTREAQKLYKQLAKEMGVTNYRTSLLAPFIIPTQA